MGNSMGANIIIIVVSLVIGVSMIPVLDVAINDSPGRTGQIATASATDIPDPILYSTSQIRAYCGPGNTIPPQAAAASGFTGSPSIEPGPMFCTVSNNAILGPFFTLLPLIVVVLLITGSMAYMKSRN